MRRSRKLSTAYRPPSALRQRSQPSARLTVAYQALVLIAAGNHLRALGRLRDAVEPTEAGLKACIAQEDWKEAAICANSLGELNLALGNVAKAVAFGTQSVELADRSGDAVERVEGRAMLADALHQEGRWEESAAAFREAEEMQKDRQPEFPRLYSLEGFLYCDLLLGQAESKAGSGLDLGLALMEGRTTELAQAAEEMDRAVDGLRRAGYENHLPRGLLARAALRRFRSDFAGAATDLTEALEIAKRGTMQLHECDARLERARLCRDQGDLDAARPHVARARELVNETGYGRREREVRWLDGCWGKKAAAWCKIASMQLATGTVVDGKIVVEGEPLPEGSAVTILTQEAEADRHQTEQLKQSLRHPHPESLEMTEAGFAAWAEGLSEDGADLIAPGAGEEVRWTADQGWVGTGE